MHHVILTPACAHQARKRFCRDSGRERGGDSFIDDCQCREKAVSGLARCEGTSEVASVRGEPLVKEGLLVEGRPPKHGPLSKLRPVSEAPAVTGRG